MKRLLWLLGAAGLARVGYLIWDELKSSTYIWKDACITPPEIREDIRFVLRSFAQAAAGKELTWWLDYGTLLGAWRIADVMAYDFDLDIGYLAEHQEAVDQVAAELAPLGIAIRRERTSIYLHGRKVGDVEPWFGHGHDLARDEDRSRRGGALKWSREWHDDFPRAWLLPCRGLELAGAVYPVPRETERLLRRRYPTCWLGLRTPFPHKQRCWLCGGYWREAWRIFTFREAPRYRDL